MKKPTIFFIITLLYIVSNTTAQPNTWQTRGIGGGGALFFPSINQGNHNELWLACDMTAYYHSINQGATWTQTHFSNIQSGNYGQILATSTPNLYYGIDNTSINFSDATYPSKSTDGGITWTHLSGNPDNTEKTYTIHVDYNNPNRILVAYYGSLHFSNNGGTTFTNIHNAISNGAGCLVGGVYWNGNTIIIGTNDGLIVSSNGGTSFSTLATSGIPSTEVVMSFAAAKTESTTRLYCLTGGVGNVYVGLQGYDYWGVAKGIYSLDYGTSTTWTNKTSNINLTNTFPMYIGMAANNINTIYVAGSNSSGEPTIYKTSNGGNTWANTFITNNNQNIQTGWSGFQGDGSWGFGECALGFCVAADDANTLIYSDFGYAHLSTNGGTSWKSVYTATSELNPSGAPTPTQKPYHSIGIENTTCWQVFWLDSTKMFSAFSDIKGCKSTDAGDTWSSYYTVLGDNSSYRYAKNNTNNTMYVATATVHDMYQSTRLQDATLDAGDGAIKMSTDNGNTWSVIKDWNDCVVWVATDPTNNNRLYASVINSDTSKGGIWRTNNIQNGNAATWTKLPTPTRTQGHPFNIIVLNDGKVLCTFSGRRNSAGTFTNSSGVFLYDPTTNTWADRSDPQMQYWTKDVIVDPFDATQNTWYACVYSHWGCGGCEYGGLFKTTNRGVSWVLVKDSYRVGSCTINPNNTNEMYFSTETEGLWYSNNRNAANPTFSLVQSYDFRQPERIFYNPYKSHEIWVTSFGNGMKKGSDCPSISITGENNACNDGSKIYTATNIAGATYTWTVVGGTIMSGQGTNQVTVYWNASGNGSISVQVQN